MSETTHDWGNVTFGNARILFRCVRNTFRLATDYHEVAGVLNFLLKMIIWRLRGASDSERDATLKLNGVTHVLGLGTGELLTPQEIYFEQGYDKLRDFVPSQGWNVFDVGANAGVYAIQQAQRGASVYAFEPNPDCFRRLQKSVRSNDLMHRIEPTNCALGATAGAGDLNLPDGITTMGSLRPEWKSGPDSTAHKVNIETVDKMVRKFGINRIDLLKIDVEGLELDVLEGAQASLPIVDRFVIEYHSVSLGQRVIDFLRSYGITIVHDEKMYQGDESQFQGVGRGLLYACRNQPLIPTAT